MACPARQLPVPVDEISTAASTKAIDGQLHRRVRFEQVTNIVINGVWEWASPRYAVWSVAC